MTTTWEVWLSEGGQQRVLVPSDYVAKNRLVIDRNGKTMLLKHSFEHPTADPQGAYEKSHKMSPLLGG